MEKPSGVQDAGMYLELLKSCLTDLIHFQPELHPVAPKKWWQVIVVGLLRRNGLQLVRPHQPDLAARMEGRDWPWPLHAHTMIGMRRLNHLEHCLEEVILKNIPGDVIETGIWRGGACIFMRALFKVYGIEDRIVWAADSFKGVPKPDPSNRWDGDSGLHRYPELTVSLDEVKENFRRYGMLDDNVHFIEGWFKASLPLAPVKTLAVLRLDGDLYQSTMDALVHLYPKLSQGGYCIVDDYGIFPSCRQAVDDYRLKMGINASIEWIDRSCIAWRQT